MSIYNETYRLLICPLLQIGLLCTIVVVILTLWNGAMILFYNRIVKNTLYNFTNGCSYGSNGCKDQLICYSIETYPSCFGLGFMPCLIELAVCFIIYRTAQAYKIQCVTGNDVTSNDIEVDHNDIEVDHYDIEVDRYDGTYPYSSSPKIYYKPIINTNIQTTGDY